MIIPKVSLIILNWNGKDVLGECLRSASKLDYPNYNIIVVDNGSTDGSQGFVKQNFPEVHLIENETNVGYAAGQNIGIRYAIESGVDYLFVLNNDVTFERSVLNELIATFEDDESIGIAGPILYHAENPTAVQAAGNMMRWNIGRAHNVRADEIDRKSRPKAINVDYLSMFLAKTALFQRIGFFNPKYFAYWEDVDLCFRAKRAGFGTVCVLTAKIWHHEGHTSRQVVGLQTYYITRNRFWIERAYASWWARTQFYLFFFMGAFWYYCIRFLFFEKNAKAFRAFLRGIHDGLIQDNRLPSRQFWKKTAV
jgi:GT2 family glycosyltransferase